MTLPNGPLSPIYGPYIRNAQEVAPGLFLVESQRGTKGKGKVWNPSIIHGGRIAGEVKSCYGRRAGMFSALLWDGGTHITGYFHDHTRAVRFLISAAKDLFNHEPT